MNYLLKKIDWVEGAMLALVFATMIISITIQVVNRTVIKLPIGWTEELARYCMVALALFGAEIGLRDGSQICVTGFTNALPQSAQKWIDRFAIAVVCIFCAIVFYSSITILQKQLQSAQSSPAMHVPMWVPYCVVTVSFGIMTATQLMRLVGSFLRPMLTTGEGR